MLGDEAHDIVMAMAETPKPEVEEGPTWEVWKAAQFYAERETPRPKKVWINAFTVLDPPDHIIKTLGEDVIAFVKAAQPLGPGPDGFPAPWRKVMIRVVAS